MANSTNAPSTVLRQSIGLTVTLTSANTNYNLYDLVKAVIQAEGGAAANVIPPGTVRQITVQAYPGITSVGANTVDVLMGDALVSATRIGAILAPGANWSDHSDVNNCDWMWIYVRAAAVSQKINVTLTVQ